MGFVEDIGKFSQRPPSVGEYEQSNQGYREVTTDVFLRAAFSDITVQFEKVTVPTTVSAWC